LWKRTHNNTGLQASLIEVHESSDIHLESFLLFLMLFVWGNLLKNYLDKNNDQSKSVAFIDLNF